MWAQCIQRCKAACEISSRRPRTCEENLMRGHYHQRLDFQMVVEGFDVGTSRGLVTVVGRIAPWGPHGGPSTTMVPAQDPSPRTGGTA